MSKNKKSKNTTKTKKPSEFKNDLIIMKYFFKLSHKCNKKFMPVCITQSIFRAMLPILNVIMPKFIIDELLGQKRIEYLTTLVLITVIGSGILLIVDAFFSKMAEVEKNVLLYKMEADNGAHVMNLDFFNVEDPDILNLQQQANFAINNQGALWGLTYNMAAIIQQIIQLISMVAIILTLDVIIILIVFVIMLLNMTVFNKSQKKQFELNKTLIPINRSFMYYYSVCTDFSSAKDVRVYSMDKIFIRKMNEYLIDSLKVFGNLVRTSSKFNGLIATNTAIQQIFVYAFLVYKVVAKAIGIGDFTLYVNASLNFSTTLKQFLDTVVMLRSNCRYLSMYKDFKEIPPTIKNGDKILPKLDDVEIEFKNVSFKYPKSEDYILKNINITIKKGEKLSVVGLNGAGKTTFIKLICKLYYPNEGEILLNGVNINEYDFDSYMNLMSVVFQDFKMFSFSIKENIVFNNVGNVEDKKILEVIEKSGLSEKIDGLDKGINTSLYKNFDEKGIEFSGGENQKLAISRAIYKDSPLVILDEPTAALDPYAEYEIYHKFNELVENKAAIYISHRLSSCRFCDVIAVFKAGEIVEYGKHDVLVSQNGLYSEMWAAQAEYYK